jgi:hypothetical protein
MKFWDQLQDIYNQKQDETRQQLNISNLNKISVHYRCKQAQYFIIMVYAFPN